VGGTRVRCEGGMSHGKAVFWKIHPRHGFPGRCPWAEGLRPRWAWSMARTDYNLPLCGHLTIMWWRRWG
jgi:hypothetical protein